MSRASTVPKIRPALEALRDRLRLHHDGAALEAVGDIEASLTTDSNKYTDDERKDFYILAAATQVICWDQNEADAYRARLRDLLVEDKAYNQAIAEIDRLSKEYATTLPSWWLRVEIAVNAIRRWINAKWLAIIR